MADEIKEFAKDRCFIHRLERIEEPAVPIVVENSQLNVDCIGGKHKSSQRPDSPLSTAEKTGSDQAAQAIGRYGCPHVSELIEVNAEQVCRKVDTDVRHAAGTVKRRSAHRRHRRKRSMALLIRGVDRALESA